MGDATEKMDKPAVPAHQKRRSKIASKLVARSREESTKEAERAKILLRDRVGGIEVENPMEKTWRATQKVILEDADDNTRAKAMDLKLGQKYAIRFTRSGRHIVLGGERGHLAVVDALRQRVITEVNLENEVVHDVTPLHNESLFAAAQRKYLYIYDHTGTEVHQLRSHIEPRKIEFLPYHFLLASVGRSSRVVYQDVSTGSLVASLRSRMGPCSILAQNPKTAVLATGHAGGIVALWAPTNGDALAKIMCHPAPITAVGFDRSGQRMVTSALDGRVSIWDARKLGDKLNTYHVRAPRVATCLSVSDTGLLAVANSGGEVTIWKDVFGEEKQKDPYLTYRMPSGHVASSLHFRPYEDVLGIGYGAGVQSIIVPGAGEANYDAYEANPFERKSQRRETEVRRLLDKLPADTIGLEKIGEVFETGEVKAKTLLDQLLEKKNKGKPTPSETATNAEDDSIVLGEGENTAKQVPAKEAAPKKKMKGRGKIGSRLKVKHRNIITIEREKRRQALEEEGKGHKTASSSTGDTSSGGADEERPGMAALSRLAKRAKRSK